MKLTKKQEIFCQEVIKQGSYSDAYRIAYSVKKSTSKTINESASLLMSDPKISARVNELRQMMAEKELYTLEESVKRDLRLIERYEAALDVLEDISSSGRDLEAAERLIKFIGPSGYSSAQERLSKQHGFYERDNKQKQSPLPILTMRLDKDEV